MSIIGTLTPTIANGDLEDATVVMALFAFIRAQVNANAAVAGPLAASGITGAAASGANGDITSLSALASINGGPLAGLHNVLMNGNFPLNQRAVSGTVTLVAGAYGHDRWKAGAGGCTYTFAAVGNSTVITISAGSLMQVIEDKNVAGGIYTLSQQGTAQGRIAVNGAATSGAYGALPLASASATGGQTMTVEFTTGTIDRAQLEPGTVATPFERRPIGIELALCQRYSLPLVGSMIGQAFNASTGGFFLYLPVPMRATPSLSTTAGFTVTTAGGGTNAVTPGAPSLANPNVIRIDISGATTLVAGNASFLIPPAGVILSAEL